MPEVRKLGKNCNHSWGSREGGTEKTFPGSPDILIAERKKQSKKKKNGKGGEEGQEGGGKLLLRGFPGPGEQSGLLKNQKGLR